MPNLDEKNCLTARQARQIVAFEGVLPLRPWLLVWAGFWFLSLAPTRGAEAALPTYAEWRTACSRLPANRVLNGRMPPKEVLPLQTFAEFERALDAFLAVATNGPLSQTDRWVGNAPSRETFFDLNRAWFLPKPETPFEPFAAKLVLPPTSQVLLQGDLHGDILSLMAVLERWNERHWLEGFKVVDPNVHVIFLGDFTDRGFYGIEVLYTLFRLKAANPDRVHLCRGNHEDVSLVSRYGFLAEARAKYGQSFNAAKVLRAYDFLPVVTYLGTGQDFVQLCHGGMEPGFTPAPLLAAEGTNRFRLLGALNQATFLRTQLGQLKLDSTAAAEAKAHFRDFTPAAPTTPQVIGFMWNDFTVFADEPAFANNPDRAYVYGQPMVERILQFAGTGAGSAHVHAVIRAHQHSGLPNPLMRRLVASQGAFRHWQEKFSKLAESAEGAALTAGIETSATRPLTEGSVWTLNVTPDSVYGMGNQFGFATTARLQMGAQFDAWRLSIETVEVSLANRR